MWSSSLLLDNKVRWCACCVLYPLWLQATLLAEHFTVPDLGFYEILLGGRQEETFRIHRSDDIVPDGTALAVIAAHPSWQILLYHLWMSPWIRTGWLKLVQVRRAFTSGGRQSVIIISTFICFLNSRCCKKRQKWSRPDPTCSQAVWAAAEWRIKWFRWSKSSHQQIRDQLWTAI